MASGIATKQIVLDESAENQPPEDFTIVKTEIEFLKHDGATEKIWVRGAQLCEYVRVLCQARKIKFEEIVSPRSRLYALAGDAAGRVNAEMLRQIIEIIEREKPKSLADLLFHMTNNVVWLAPVSNEHAAQILTLDVADELRDLAEKQRKIWRETNENPKLDAIYAVAFEEREDFLRKWLFDEEIRHYLGEFPILLEGKHHIILREKIEGDLRQTQGLSATDFPKNTPNKEIYALAALDYFSHHPARLNLNLLAAVSPLLSVAERAKLENLLPTTEIAPLSAYADWHSALDWATESYFPFRKHEEKTGNCGETNALAASFADWLLENYPKMAFGDYEDSPINLRTFYTVKNLQAQGFWVLWAVVDGLSYPNHQKLLQSIGTKSAKLRAIENAGLFAILPTITEKAKYGLTSGKFPSENVRNDWSAKSNFKRNFPGGVYAGSAAMGKMTDGLQCETPTVCYWNYLKIDECFHDETDSNSCEIEVEAQIEALAARINLLVESAHDKQRVAVVICSDHGQMTSVCRKLEIDLGSRQAHGRTVLDSSETIFNDTDSSFVKSADGETVYLNPKNFRLSEPTTVALGTGYFVDLKATKETGAIGVHGGLFPEEAIVGLAVLMPDATRQKLSANISGNGESGNAGTIILIVDNPNSVRVKNLSMTIENLETDEQSALHPVKVAAKDAMRFEIHVEKFPAPISGEDFKIRGILRYEFDDGTQDECAVGGNLICRSLYASKNPRLLDRFKK